MIFYLIYTMEGFGIIYESLDAKTRRRIDAKLAERQEDDIIQRKEFKEFKEQEENGGYMCLRIGITTIIVSLIVALCVFVLVGDDEIIEVCVLSAFIGFFYSIIGCCGIYK
jgi:hypothetical protein